SGTGGRFRLVRANETQRWSFDRCLAPPRGEETLLNGLVDITRLPKRLILEPALHPQPLRSQPNGLLEIQRALAKQGAPEREHLCFLIQLEKTLAFPQRFGNDHVAYAANHSLINRGFPITGDQLVDLTICRTPQIRTHMLHQVADAAGQFRGDPAIENPRCGVALEAR